MRLFHHLTAVVLCLGLVAGNAAVCAGWAATPEERMACCAEGGDCPMHHRESHDIGSGKVLTQVDADTCCLSSEPAHSTNPSTSVFGATISFAVLGPGVALTTPAPALVLSDRWRTVSPIPAAPVPKHVLLSVFLI